MWVQRGCVSWVLLSVMSCPRTGEGDRRVPALTIRDDRTGRVDDEEPRATPDQAPAGGPAPITAPTPSIVASAGSNPVRHHVAPAATYGAGSSPGSSATTTSNGA